MKKEFLTVFIWITTIISVYVFLLLLTGPTVFIWIMLIVMFYITLVILVAWFVMYLLNRLSDNYRVVQRRDGMFDKAFSSKFLNKVAKWSCSITFFLLVAFVVLALGTDALKLG